MARAVALSVVLLGFSDFWGSAWAGTTCATGQLDWYTSVVGENPCETYQRLRQICNPTYQVPSLSSTPPGDFCEDEDPACCCNTISFQLSMLCENCQHVKMDGYAVGIDAPIGTYQKYLNGCNPWKNDELPPKVQTAACDVGMRLDDLLYDSWEDGAWFYVWTKDNSILRHTARNNDTFTHCPTQALSSPSSTFATGNISTTYASYTEITSPSTTSEGGPPNGALGVIRAKTPPGTIAGVVVGVLLIITIAAFAIWFLRRECLRNERQRSRILRWRSKTPGPQMSTTSPALQSYTPRPVPPSPISALPNPHSPRPEPLLLFHPEAMVRNPNSTPVPPRDTRELGRHSARRRSNGSNLDSRVGEPIDNSPDPHMPLVPLRLEEKGKLS